MEPLAIVRPQGIKAKIFYTAYQTNGYGLAVPADSPIQKAADLKGKNIGVTNMASAGVIIARAQVAAAGLNPDPDVTIVVAGEGAQPAAHDPKPSRWTRSASSTPSTRSSTTPGSRCAGSTAAAIERFPGNGFLALEETVKTRRKELVGARPGLRQGHHLRAQQPRGGGAHRLRGVPADASPPARTRRRPCAKT